LELLNWYIERKPEFAKVLYENALKNNQMTSPSIQKDMVKTCAEETSLVIINEFRNKLFVVLIDESRDASVKKQMVVVLRLITNASKFN
jgi:Domain of unknown function (DUF4371)